MNQIVDLVSRDRYTVSQAMQKVSIDLPFLGLDALFREADLARIEHRASWTGSILQTLDQLDQIWSDRTTARLREQINARSMEETHRHLSNALEIVDSLYQLDQLIIEYDATSIPEPVIATSRQLARCLALTTDRITPYGPELQKIFELVSLQIAKSSHRTRIHSLIVSVIGAIVGEYDPRQSGVYRIQIEQGSAPKLASYQRFAMITPIAPELISGWTDDQIMERLFQRAVASKPCFRMSGGSQDSWFQLVLSDRPEDPIASLTEGCPNGTYPEGCPNGTYPEGCPNGTYPEGCPNGTYQIRVTNLPEGVVCTY